MANYLSLHYHIVFSTKNRVPYLEKDWRDRLHAYLSGTVSGLKAFPQNTGGWNDHVHLLLGMPATHCVSDLVREVKKASNKWIREEIGVRNFEWQDNYAAFTVGHREREIVRSYIDHQEEHHRKKTFQEELLVLLNDHGVEFNPKYFG